VKFMEQHVAQLSVRRHYPRFPITGEMRVSRLPLFGMQGQPEQVVEGEIQNISSGGVCVLTRQPLTVSDVFRGEIGLEPIPITIPVLSDVRWVEQLGNDLYRVGLRFAV
jgi:hypothetical protein